MLLSVFLNKIYNGSRITVVERNGTDEGAVIYEGLVNRFYNEFAQDEFELMEVGISSSENIQIEVERKGNNSERFAMLEYVLRRDVQVEIILDSGVSIDTFYIGTLDNMPPEDLSFVKTLEVLECGATLDGIISVTLRSVQ